jgi:triphosphoribosyl-dephospho-CoA synthase
VNTFDAAPPVGLCAQLACIWEATARKPGNVHRYRDFEDVTYLDFIASAAAMAPVLEGARDRPVGETVLEAIRVTRCVTGTNTNLGIVLLLVPLAKALASRRLDQGLLDVIAGLDVADAVAVYQAIRLAVPGGMGKVSDQDVLQVPTLSLRAVMALAADRDLIARQYSNHFEDIFLMGLPALEEGLKVAGDLERAIIYCHLFLMAEYPDSLIQRKRGRAEAEEASQRARQVLEAGWPAGGHDALRELDAWLREDGHQRNPGTTADLVTACLFVALRQRIITLPVAFAAPPAGRK